jgi:hypothetical protein
MDRPVLHCIVARVTKRGDVLPLTPPLEVTTLAAAAEMRADDARIVILLDPVDEIALAHYERLQKPWNNVRWCNGE